MSQQRASKKEQALLLIEDEGKELETSNELNDVFFTDGIILQLELIDEKKLKLAEKVLENIIISERLI